MHTLKITLEAIVGELCHTHTHIKRTLVVIVGELWRRFFFFKFSLRKFMLLVALRNISMPNI